MKRIDTSKLCTKLTESAKQVISFLESKLQKEKDGSYGAEVKDIACYFKSPMLFLTGNRPHSADAVLNHIQAKFMTADGDFRNSPNTRSTNGAYNEYASYMNGWIVRAAHRRGRTDISQPGYNYLKQYNLGENAGFLTNDVKTQSSVTDILTVAHHGLVNLEMENMDIAISAGNYLCKVLSKQPNLSEGFYLRLDKQGEVITQFAKEQTGFNFVSTTEPNQLHFMIGYPAAYLALLYKKTRTEEFLNAAKAYLLLELKKICTTQKHSIKLIEKLSGNFSL